MSQAFITPNPALQAALRREILPEERILWQGQPQARRQWGAFAIWLFAVPWTVFSLFWEAMALTPWLASSHTPNLLRYGVGIVFPIFGLPFIAIGFWMLWKPIRAMRQAGQTLVVLTDKRLLRLVVESGHGAGNACESVMLAQIGPISRREAADGVGDLSIQTHSRTDSDGDRITERFVVTGLADIGGLERMILANSR